MIDGDVLLGEIIVKSGRMTREAVDRALAEVAHRRASGQVLGLARQVLEQGLMDQGSLERLEREARALVGTHDPDASGEGATPASRPAPLPRPARPSTRLGTAPPDAPPAAEPRRTSTGRIDTRLLGDEVGFRTAVIPTVQGAAGAPPPRKSSRLEPSLVQSAATPVPPPPPSLSASSPAASPAALGRTWGRYEILSEVARGAMGAVYRAHDTRRRQEVALKVLLQGNQADGEDLERFKREARSLARLAHPSIVRVYDYGVEGGCPFITMDFVAGTTLESIIKGGGLPLERGLVILEEVARAIDHAHSRGVVHRDLKPANVLIGADGRARITDFGLAKILDEGQHLTRAGDLIGTPLYMSPEQIRGDLTALGASSDVWSLGVTLYLLLTAQQPFGAKTIDEVAKRVLHEEPVPPEKLRAGVSPDLSRICLTALEKDSKRRYQSAGELASDLRHYLHGKPVLAGRVTPLMRLRRAVRAARLRVGSGTNLVVLLGLALATTATVGVALTLGAHATDSPSTASKPLGRLKVLVDALEERKVPTTPEAASLELKQAFMDVAAVTSGDVEFLARAGHLRARGHRALATLPPPDPGTPHAADEWAARQYALASETLSGAETRDVLAPLVAAVGRTRNAALRQDAHRRIHALAGMAERDLSLSALDGRGASLAGDWAQARETLEKVLRSTNPALPQPEREPALLAYLDALLANDELEAVADRARKEEALVGTDAFAAGRIARLRLVEAHARRLRATAEGQPSQWQKVLEDARARVPLLKGEPLASPLRIALATEDALAFVDAGAPAAALESLRAVPPSDDEPAVVVARARARVLGEEPLWGAPTESALVAIALTPEALPETRADAAQAAVELALESGSHEPILDTLERGVARSGSTSPRLATRLALLRAAPAVLQAVARLSGEWAGEVAPAPPPTSVAALAAVAASGATREAFEARAWLLVLHRADVPTGFAGTELLKAISAEGVTNASALEARALDAATASVPVSGRGADWLASTIWPHGEASPEVLRLYDFASAVRADDPGAPATLLGRETLDPDAEGVRRLLAIVADRIAEATAWLPQTQADHAPARAPDQIAARLEQADRLIEVALHRDPLSACAHRARAELALARAQLSALAETEPDRVRENVRTARLSAAAAVLLDPFDRADVALAAKVARACGDAEQARRWAQRVRTATRGELDGLDAALVDAVATPGDPDRHAQSIEQLARLSLVAGKADESRALIAIVDQLDAQAQQRIEELERERREDEDAHRAPRPQQPFAFAPVSVQLQRRIADARYVKGDPVSWAELALAWEPGIDKGLRDLAPPASDKESSVEPDAARTLGQEIQLVLRLEGERDARSAEAILARIKPLAADVLARRPRSVAARAILDYALALAGTRVEAAEALSDLARLQEVERARAAAGAWDGGPGPALPTAALALARARLAPETSNQISVEDGDATELLERPSVRPAIDRLKLRFKFR